MSREWHIKRDRNFRASLREATLTRLESPLLRAKRTSRGVVAMIPNLQNPKNRLPYDPMKLPPTVHVGD
jgi:hypothetical protein